MTTVLYLIRHAQPDYAFNPTFNRPLTEEGLNDRLKAAECLKNVRIDAVYSSPFKRAYDTVKPLADSAGIEIKTDMRLSERANGKGDEPFEEYARSQWSDFEYKREGGESLGETQRRNIMAVEEIISENEGKNIVIGTHGAALSVIINYYNPDFQYDDFMRMLDYMPFVVKLTIENGKMTSYEELFHIEKTFVKPETQNQ